MSFDLLFESVLVQIYDGVGRIRAFHVSYGRGSRFVFTGLFGFGEKMGMEVVHDNLREQRRSDQTSRAVESQKFCSRRIPDHGPTIGIRQRSQVRTVPRVDIIFFAFRKIVFFYVFLKHISDGCFAGQVNKNI